MATALLRKKMAAAYREMREPETFLAGQFEVRPDSFSTAETVAIDIVRWDEDIAPTITNICNGPTYNTSDMFTTKEFTPPSIMEAMPFDCSELVNRQPGQTEYGAEAISYQAQLVSLILDGMKKLDGKIQRNREWQASQILQTGLLTLVDQNGNPNYAIDFKPKATHFPTAGVAWNASGDPLGDIESLADVIRDDSKQDADQLYMGDATFNAFIKNTDVQAQLDNRRYEIGEIAPSPRGDGAKFQGVVNIGNYKFEIWTYNGRGVVPGDTANTKFLAPDSCIVKASSARLDTLFGGVPMPVKPDPRFANILPDRVSVPSAIDVSPNIYATNNGRQTILELASRPLCVPVAIDGFGNINTGV